MTPSRTAVVAGAGALGLASALALAKAGFRVTVYDPAPPADNASGVAAGMLAPAFEAALDALARPHLALLRQARDLWPALASEIELDLDRTPAAASGEPAWIEGLAATLHGLGVPIVAPAPLGPGHAPANGLAFAVPDDWRIDPAAALKKLRVAALAHGARFVPAPLDQAEASDVVVLAVGAASGLESLAPELAHLRPIKGHILRYPGRLGAVVRTAGAYAAPAAAGIAVGATMEEGRADLDVDPAQVEALRAAAVRLFPVLASADPRVLVGVRAAAPDGLPLVGPSRASPNLILATGARRNGWLLAPLIGRMVVAYALGEDPGPHAQAFRTRRFDR